MPSPTDLALDAWYARAAGLQPLLDALGVAQAEEAIFSGFPREVLEEPRAEHFPRIAYWAPDTDDVRPGLGEVEIRVEELVWTEGPSGFDPDAELKAIDGALYDGFFEQWWTHDGERFRVYRTEARDHPVEKGGLLWRLRRFTLGVG